MRIVPAQTKTVVPALLVRITVVFALVGSMISFTINTANASMPSNGYYGCNSGIKNTDNNLPEDFDPVNDSALTPEGHYVIFDGSLVLGSSCGGDVVVSTEAGTIQASAFNNNAWITSIFIPSNTRVNPVADDNYAQLRAFAGTDRLTTFYYCGEWPIANTGLDVEEKTWITCPSAPTMIQAFNVGNTYIKFRPSSSDGGSPTVTYTVTAYPLGGDAFEANVGIVYNDSDGLSDITQYEILGLLPEATYTFSISANNGYFDSNDSSRSVSMRTPPGDGWYLCSTGVYNEDQVNHPRSYLIDLGAVVANLNCDGAVIIRPGVIGIDEGFIESSITSVSIPESVQYLYKAFQDSTQLSQVTFLGNSQLEYLGDNSFEGTGLSTINIPTAVETIGEYAFLNATHLASVNFSNNSQLDFIDYGAFKGTVLNSITIPAGVSRIERGAFVGTASLSNIEVNNANEDFRSVNGVLFRLDEDDLYELYKYPEAKLGSSYTIPDGLESISTDAFANTDLSFVNIPSTVYFIWADAFIGTDLVSYNFCSETDLTLTWLSPEERVCYTNWRTPLSAITNGPKVGETVYASAFERELPRTLYKDENDYRANTTDYPTPEEYVYRITKQPNVPATSVDHQPYDAYESLTIAEQSNWYTEIESISGYAYQFSWKAFMCVPQSGSELTKPNELSLSYVSREDGLLSDGSFDGAHNSMFTQAATDWHQNLNLGQTLRSAVGFLPPDFVDTYTRSFLGDLDPAWHSLIWGLLDINASCGPGKELKALTITDATGSPVMTKSFDIPAQLNVEISGDNVQVSSVGVTIGVTGTASRNYFNAALWGLTTISDGTSTTPPTQEPTEPPTTPPTTTQTPTASAAISPVLTNKSIKLKASFSERSSKLSAKEKKKLLRVVASMGSKVTGGKVVGYVQLDGNTSNDRKLSTARARAVAKFLADNGIKVRLVTKGKGALNNKESSRRANITLRYVE